MIRRLLTLVIFFGIFSSSDAQFRNRNNNNQSENFSSQKEYEIASIEITGLNVLDKNALISLTGLRVGDKIKIPGDAIATAIRKLWNHGLVGDVTVKADKIEGSRIWLIIELSELPRLTGFSFEGVNQSRESELKEDLNLYRGKVVTNAIINKTQLTVKRKYEERGFHHAKVNIVQVMDSINADGVKLRIVVVPGSKIKINKIIIEGNEDIPDGKLKRKMKNTAEKVRFTIPKKLFQMVAGLTPRKIGNFATKTYDMSYNDINTWLNENVKLNFFKASKFKKTDFKEDKQALIDFYNTKGYRDATIISDSVFVYNEKMLNIKLKVNEGNKYYFRSIDWVGNYVYTDATLSAVLDVKSGDIYNKEQIEKKVNFNPKGLDISGLYMDDGYLFFRIDPVEIRIEGDSIDLEMRIYEGDQATIDQVTFSGNDRTSDHVIRRELNTVPGEKFRRSDLISTQQRLSQMGYFDPEQIAPNYVPNPEEGTVDINWGLVERSNDQIELSGGWGGFYGFVGTLGLTLNNFSAQNLFKGKFEPLPVGDGQRLSVRVQANGRQYQNYSFSFTEPWLGGRKPNSFTISLNNTVLRSRRGQDTDGDGIVDFTPFFGDFNSTIIMQGITVGLGKRLVWPDNYFTLASSLSYQKYKLDNYFDLGQGFENGDANNITLNLTLSRNSMDSPMYPKSGSSVQIAANFTPPHSYWRDIDYETATPQQQFKWIEYHKWMIDTKFYLNLIDKFVIEAKAHFGIIGRYNPNLNVGPFERFYVGGSGLAGQQFIIANDVVALRGYDDNAVTPPFNRIDSKQGVRGGIMYDKFGLELRYPVSTAEAATIYGFIFAEGGNNWFNYEDFNPFDLYRSLGMGVRVFMPAFGLVGINWAYGFDTLPGQNERSGPQFHFTIGQQIR